MKEKRGINRYFLTAPLLGNFQLMCGFWALISSLSHMFQIAGLARHI